MADEDLSWADEVVVVRAERPRPRTYYPRCRVELKVIFREAPDREDTVHAFTVVPRGVTIDRNSYREADAVQVELDHRDFPLDPRTLASVWMAVHLADAGDPRVDVPLDGSALRFVGYADEPETTLGDGGETVRLQGRDYTSLFLDHRWSDGPLNATRPAALTVQSVLSAVPGAATIPFDPGGLAGKKIRDVTGKTTWTPEDGDDAWTVLDRIGGLWGFVPTVVIDRLVFRTPSQVRGRSVRLVYGSNVSRLRYTRKLTEKKLVQVELRAYDPSAGTTRTVTWPDKPLVVAKKVDAQGKATPQYAPKLPFYVEGTYTDAELLELAKAVFDEGAQADTEGTISTREMADLFGEDLCALSNGDEVVVRLGKQDETALGGLTDEEAVNYLRSRPQPFDEFAARAIVAAWRRAEDLQIRFYVTRAAHKWSREDGYELEVQFATYAGGQPPAR